MSAVEPEPRASRALALLFGVMCGIGVGHAYAGKLRRAFLWALVFVVCGVLGAVALLKAPARFSLLTFLLLWACAWLGPLVDLARTPKSAFGKPSYVGLVAFAVGMFCLQVGTATSLRMFVVEAFKIPSGGMLPTLVMQDHIFVDKAAYRGAPPKRGDILVYTGVDHPDADFVHRVLAVSGDTIAFEDGRPVINGWHVPHCSVGSVKMDSGGTGQLEVEYLEGRAFLTLREETLHDARGPWTLGADEYFVVGDNRDNSADSRVWFGGKGGAVPRANVKGRAHQVWMGFSGADIDWSRSGIALDSVTLPKSMESLRAKLDDCLGRRPAAATPPPPRPV